MDLEKAQETLGAVGSDSAPSVEQLTAARAAFIGAARVAKDNADRSSLAAMLEAVKVADLAIAEANELAAKESNELDELVKDIPELAADASEELSTETAAPVADAPRVLTVAEAAQKLGLMTSADRIEVNEPAAPVQTLTINGEDASDASWSRLGDAFAKNAKSAMRTGRTTIATFRTEYSTNLTGKQGENTRILDELTRQSADPAVIAAGGCCSLAEPIRDQPMLASLARPIADSLPTIGANAGAVSLFPPVCLPQAGVHTWSCAQDAAVDEADPETWKQCDEIDCEDVDTVTVEAIYRCLTIGNFQQRFNPERWDAILHASAAQQARTAEIQLFNTIANSEYTTTHTAQETGSVYATFLQAILLAAATIRQNQRYEGVRMKVIAPKWLQEAVSSDRIARAVARGRMVEGVGVDTILAENGVDITWSPDLNPIESVAQVDGPLTAFPATASVVIYADGGVFRLDGGELNLGTEIRDHDLNRQNKVAAFTESFETALVRSCDTKAITIPVTVCGSAPCGPGAGSAEDNPLFMQTVPAA